jgi:hypothetical protein
MHLDKSLLKEEGYLADELIAESGISPLDRKCFVVRQTIADGDFTLEEALEAYGVTKEEYTKYLTKHMVSEFNSEFNVFRSNPDVATRVLAVTASIAVIGEIYKVLLGGVDKEAQLIQDHLQLLSQNVSTGKVAV